jgi:HKD family nuclease
MAIIEPKSIQLIQNPTEKRLLNMISAVRASLFVVTPFFKEGMIDKVLSSLKEGKLRVLLRTDAFDMAGGISDLNALRKLAQHGAEIREIRNLHAKVIVFDEKKALITSSNLTKSGLNTNVEIGILVEDEEFIKNDVMPILNQYWQAAGEVKTSKMDEIQSDVEDILRLDEIRSSSEIEMPSIKTQGRFVSPKGKDEERIVKELTMQEKYELMASELMRGRLNKNQVLSIVNRFFDTAKMSGDEKRNICLGAMSYSFDSDNPFTTGGNYFSNVNYIYPGIKAIFQGQLPATFRNMILDKGKTKVSIRSVSDYRRIQKELYENFDLVPPKSTDVFNAIIEDRAALKRMANNIEYYHRIKRILPFAAGKLMRELEKDLLREMNGIKESRSRELKFEKDARRIESLEKELRNIEENIRILKIKAQF